MVCHKIRTIKMESDEDSFTFTLFTGCKNKYIEARNTVDKNLGAVLHQKEEETVKPISDVQFDYTSINLVHDVRSSVNSQDVLEDVPLNVRLNSRFTKRNCNNRSTSKSERGRSSQAVTKRGRGRRGRKRSSRNENQEQPISETNVAVEQPISETIAIEDSDSENESKMTNDDSVLLDCSLPLEIENSEMSVRVWWKFKVFHKFQIRKFQKLTSVYEQLSKLENVPEDQIVLILREEIISSKDTPESLKLTVTDILEGGTTRHQLVAAPSVQNTNMDKNQLEFKLIFKDNKKPLLVSIGKNDKMKLLMIKCAEQMEIPMENLKFTFDGDDLDSGETPVDLDLEGGECIEVSIQK